MTAVTFKMPGRDNHRLEARGVRAWARVVKALVGPAGTGWAGPGALTVGGSVPMSLTVRTAPVPTLRGC